MIPFPETNSSLLKINELKDDISFLNGNFVGCYVSFREM